jgi:AAA15 family ATPase/GTPase
MKDKIRYKEILLPTEEPFSNYQIGDPNSISPLALINIFIGTNNSGKSRLLRALFAFQEPSYNTNIHSAKDLEKLTDELDSEFTEAFPENILASSSTGSSGSLQVVQIAGMTKDYIKNSVPNTNNSISDFISYNYHEYKILKNILERIVNCDIENGSYSVRQYNDGSTPSTTWLK